MERDVDKFRTLIILAIATWLFANFVSFNAAPPPEEVASIYDWQGYGQVEDLFWAAYWVFSMFTVGMVDRARHSCCGCKACHSKLISRSSSANK